MLFSDTHDRAESPKALQRSSSKKLETITPAQRSFSPHRTSSFKNYDSPDSGLNSQARELSAA
jgi:hypothetical protein